MTEKKKIYLRAILRVETNVCDEADRDNASLLKAIIKSAARHYLTYHRFKFNDDFTRNRIRSDISIFLQEMKNRCFFSDYNIICDKTNNKKDFIDRKELYIDVYLHHTP